MPTREGVVQHPRGFSLIEVMVVVAILGILAALAAPNLLFEVQKANLQASADTVAAFLVRAQNEAMVSRRCVRVRVTGARQLTADRLNTFDCDTDPVSASRINGATPVDATTLFVPVGVLNLEAAAVTVALLQVPSECNPAPGGVGAEIRFRPSGRVFSNDADLNDDDGVLTLIHGQMPTGGNANRQKILVNGNGLMCVFKRGIEPATATSGAPNLDCP